MRLTPIALGLALLATTPAWATGTLFCEASQKEIQISFDAIAPFEYGNPLSQASGAVTVTENGLPPDVVELNSDNNTQYWLDDDMLNLAFYTEGQVGTQFHSTELIIKTRIRADHAGYYDGEFHFESYREPPDGTGKPVRVNTDGKVTCSFG